MITVLDVETSFQIVDGKVDPLPFNPNNCLVSIGVNDEYYFFNHNHESFDIQSNHKAVQDILDKTTLLVGHNIKFDLVWLLESGFKYTGRLYDTMIGEYILLRGLRKPLSLKDICKRRSISQKSDAVDDYMKRKISFEDIPVSIIEEYGRQDVVSTRALFNAQIVDFKKEGNKPLLKSAKMMNEFLPVLADMEINGINIDLNALNAVEQEFKEEFGRLAQEIKKIIREKMGDTPINPASTEQLSWLIYSRKVIDKKKWAETFNIGIDKFTKRKKRRPTLSKSKFRDLVALNTKTIKQTSAAQCSHCEGKGLIRRFKVNGEPFKNLTKCPHCNGEGVIYLQLNRTAGFNQMPVGVSEVAEGGFKTDRDTLKKLSMRAQGDMKEFVDLIIRYNAIDTYLNTFVNGIRDHVNEDSVLHPKFMQCVTATARLSSRDPNFQNQPRGNTFPIRKVISSRFKGGKIMEIDFSQLEFRTAVFLAQDKQGMKDIDDGVDVHQFTADTIGVSRQDAKAHTFKPLYGGMSGSDSEKRYYKAFLEKYKDIAKWHETLQSTAIEFKKVKLPSGREYSFPYAQRQAWGGSSYSTQIKNYPVQGFATADIVPIACINAYKMMRDKGVKSLLINTVHDSIVVDAHPDEIELMTDLLDKATRNVIDSLYDFYKVEFNVPLDTELKIGDNWLEMNEVSLKKERIVM
jgi:DNA polymerase I-like protein with 3'-5' exonuclease and polymerase domains